MRTQKKIEFEFYAKNPYLLKPAFYGFIGTVKVAFWKGEATRSVN